MTHPRIVAVFLLVFSGSAAVYPPEITITPEPTRKRLVKRLVGKGALVGAGISTGWGYVTNRPHEWGRGAAGVKRFASGIGKHAVGTTVQLGVSALRHEDLSYRRSEETGFKRRLRHALVSTVVARKTTTGKPTVAAGRVSGAVASGFVSRLWQPARLHTFSSGLATSGISMGVDAGVHVAREFWPEIRHPRRTLSRPKY